MVNECLIDRLSVPPLQSRSHFLLCQTLLNGRLIALHKSTPLTLMPCQCVTVNQLFFKCCITAWCYMMTGFLLEYTHECAFFSRQTLTFSASLSLLPISLPHFFFLFTLILFFLTSPSHSVVFPLFVHCSALLPHVTSLPLRLPSPSWLPHPYDFWPFYPFRQAVSSPPLSLAHSSQPYFLHTALPPFRPGYCNSQPFADPRPHRHVGRESKDDERCYTQWAPAPSSACIHRDDSSSELNAGFDYESLADFGVDFPCDDENIFNTLGDFASDSVSNFDSLYCSDSERDSGTHSKPDTPVSSTTEAPGCTTPYKNIDVMMTYSNSAMDSLYSDKRSQTDHNSYKARTSKELPPLPTYYLYHPKNCPLHRGHPPRLSPIGALSPPQRSGAPPPGAAGTSLNSPLFPRSHTLPALAAPLYYPNLYPPIPPRAPPLPPKLHQAPPQSRVASKTSLSSLSLHLSHFVWHLASMSVSLSNSLLLIWWPSHFCPYFNPRDLQIWKNWVTVAVLCISRQLPAGHPIHLIYPVLSNLQRALRRGTAVPVRGCLEPLSSLSFSLSSSVGLSVCLCVRLVCSVYLLFLCSHVVLSWKHFMPSTTQVACWMMIFLF